MEAHKHQVGGPSAVAGRDADQASGEDTEANRHHRYRQRDPAAVDDPGEDVTAELVRPQPVARPGGQQVVVRAGGYGVVRRDPGCEDGGDDEHRQQGRRDQHPGMPPYQGRWRERLLQLLQGPAVYFGAVDLDGAAHKFTST